MKDPKNPREHSKGLIKIRIGRGVDEGTDDFTNDPILIDLEGDGIKVSANENDTLAAHIQVIKEI